MNSVEIFKEGTKALGRNIRSAGIPLEGRFLCDVVARAVGSDKAYGPLCAAVRADHTVLTGLEVTPDNIERAIEFAVSKEPKSATWEWGKFRSMDFEKFNLLVKQASRGRTVFVDK